MQPPRGLASYNHGTAMGTRTTIVGGLTLLLTPCIASAQNALDAGQRNAPARPDPLGSPVTQQTYTARGRALDANSQVGSSGFNAPVANFQQELALRNAVVTGNVAGGKAFRGDVGYGAADDFRGETGSDDLFEFQRDSAYSGLATQSIRGITPLQFQLTESTAGQTQGMLGDLIVRRSSAGVSANDLDPATARINVDPYANLRGSLRSTSDFVLRNTRYPFVLGTLGKETEGASRLYMASNPLIGVKAITLGNSAFAAQERPDLILEGKISGLSDQEREDAGRDGLSAPVGKRIEPSTPLDSVRTDLARKADNFLSKPYVDRPVREGEAPEAEADRGIDPSESIDQRFNRMLDEVRDSLRKRLKSMEEAAPPSEEPSSENEGNEPEGNAGQKDEIDRRGKTLSPEEIIARARGLLDNGDVRIQALLDQNDTDDLYSWHMRKGEVALRTDRWFEAEERFTAALRSKPGDAIAAAGRINAQLGGGLFLSAGVNMRNLFAAYPELIPARYTAELFPSGKRLDGVKLTLRDRMKKTHTPFAREAATLLAYVGWQTESSKDVADAFTALDEAHRVAGDAPDALELLLREIWLKNDQPAIP